MVALLSVPAALAAHPAAAASPATAKSASAAVSSATACRALQQQWDRVAARHRNDAGFVPARELRFEGGELCFNGRPVAGIAKLEQALEDIGVKPRG